MASVFNISNTANTLSITLAPGQLNGPGGAQSTTDLRLYGMGAHLWGEGVGENLVRILENFAAPPKEAGDFNPATGNNDYDPNSDPVLPKDANDIGPGKGINNPLTGQLWYNTDDGVMYIFDENVAGMGGIFGWKRDTGVAIDSSAPSATQVGDLWFDTGVEQLMVWDGSTWVSVAERYLLLDGTSTMTGSLDLGNNTIINVTDPINSQDAATRNYVDNEITNITTGGSLDGTYVRRDGSSMSGILTLDATSGSRLSVSYTSSTLTIGNGGDITSGSDVRKTGNLLTSADGNVYVHFSTGNSFRVAQGGNNRGSGFSDYLTVTTDGLVNVQSAYETLTLVDTSLVNKKYVDDEITSRTVEVTGGNFTGNVGINIPSPTEALDVDGNIQATGDITAFASDIRLKENISLLENCLDRVRGITPVEFDWSEEAYNLGLDPYNKHQTGVLAQDVEKVLPDVIRPAPFNGDYLTVQYEKLTTVLVGAVHELADKTEQLQAKLDMLEQRLNEIDQ